MASRRGIGWATALAATCWTLPVASQDAPPAPAAPARRASRAASELGLTFGGMVYLHRDEGFRPMPLGVRGGYQFDSGPYVGAALDWTFALPKETKAGSGYDQFAAELGYDISPLPKLAAVPFARLGYALTFQTRCEDHVIGGCTQTKDEGAIGQLGVRTLFRVGNHFFSGLEFHYQFGVLQNVGFRFTSGARF